MRIAEYDRPPGLIAAWLAASGGHLLASFLIGLASVPFALVTWSGLALSGDPSTPSLRLLLPWLLVLLSQPFIAAWIAQSALALLDAGKVTYRRACGAMVLALGVSVASAFVLPAEAALPVLGYAWTGAAAAALILAAHPAGAAS